MPYELCRHIKTNGKCCQSAALTGENWCFFHARLHFRHRAVRSAKAVVASTPLILPAIEDRESIQVAASIIVGALATGHLEDKRATALLRALQLASRNLASFVDTEPHPDITVRSYTPTLDGLELAPRQMSDNSAPPRRDRATKEGGGQLKQIGQEKRDLSRSGQKRHLGKSSKKRHLDRATRVERPPHFALPHPI